MDFPKISTHSDTREPVGNTIPVTSGFPKISTGPSTLPRDKGELEGAMVKQHSFIQQLKGGLASAHAELDKMIGLHNRLK